MLRRLPTLKTIATVVIAAFSIVCTAPQASAEQSCPARVLTTPIYWDIDRLASVRSKLAGGESEYVAAYEALIRDADKALLQSPYSVTHKDRAGPSDDKRDYVSLSRYFWTNPKKSDGLPYIRKDGLTNPEYNGDNFDRRRSQNMTDDVRALALAAYFTGHQAYADKAKTLTETWFLDEETGMNPNLKFAQNVPGKTEGREFGILDGRIYWDVIDSLLLLKSVDMVDRTHLRDMRIWFGQYVTWLLTSDFGTKAKAKKNNHGVYYDAQLAHILMFAGRCDLAKKVVQSGYNRTKDQIHKSGLMPYEKERTQSLFYHAFNLRAFLRLTHYGRQLDLDIYNKTKGKKSGSIKNSVDFVASYAGRVEDWPYQEISQHIDRGLWRMIRSAQVLDESENLDDALERLAYDNATAQENLLFGE
jgi:hypothetical protein